MSPSPAHDSHGFTAAGIRASTPTAVANSAPTPNSHTRAKVSKYAHVGPCRGLVQRPPQGGGDDACHHRGGEPHPAAVGPRFAGDDQPDEEDQRRPDEVELFLDRQ